DVKNDSLDVPSGVEGIVIDTQLFSRRASMSEDAKKQADKEQKEVENRANKAIADQFRALMAELAGVLDVKQIKDTLSNKVLGQDKDDRVLVDQAQIFRLDHLDVRTRQAEAEEVFRRHKERLDFLFDERERNLNSLKPAHH